MIISTELEEEVKKGGVTGVAGGAAAQDDAMIDSEEEDDSEVGETVTAVTISEQEREVIAYHMRHRIKELCQDKCKFVVDEGEYLLVKALSVETDTDVTAVYDALNFLYPKKGIEQKKGTFRIEWIEFKRGAIEKLNEKYLLAKVLLEAKDSRDNEEIDSDLETDRVDEVSVDQQQLQDVAQDKLVAPLVSGAFLAAHRATYQQPTTTESPASYYTRQRIAAMPLVEKIKTAHHVAQEAVGKELFMVVGKSGAGKSTFINSLNGTIYQKGEGEVSGEVVAVPARDNKIPEVVRVGQKSMESETILPTFINLPEQSLVLCDCPGFSDTNPELELSNRLAIKFAAQFASRINGIIVVVEYEAFFGDGKYQGFRSLFNLLSELVAVDSSIENSITFVITKAHELATVEEIAKLVQNRKKTFESALNQEDLKLMQQVGKERTLADEPLPEISEHIKSTRDMLGLMELMQDRILMYDVFSSGNPRRKSRKDTITYLRQLKSVAKTAINLPLTGIMATEFHEAFVALARQGVDLLEEKKKLSEQKSKNQRQHLRNAELAAAYLKSLIEAKTGVQNFLKFLVEAGGTELRNNKAKIDELTEDIKELTGETENVGATFEEIAGGKIGETRTRLQDLEKTEALEEIKLDPVAVSRGWVDRIGWFSWHKIPGGKDSDGKDYRYSNEALIVGTPEYTYDETKAEKYSLQGFAFGKKCTYENKDENKEEKKEGVTYRTNFLAYFRPPYGSTGKVTVTLRFKVKELRRTKDEIDRLGKELESLKTTLKDKTNELARLSLIEKEIEKRMQEKAALLEKIKEGKTNEELEKYNADIQSQKIPLPPEVAAKQKDEIGRIESELQTLMSDEAQLRLTERTMIVREQRIRHEIYTNMPVFDLLVSLGAMQLDLLLFRELYRSPEVIKFLAQYEQALQSEVRFTFCQTDVKDLVEKVRSVHIMGEFNGYLKKRPEEMDEDYAQREQEWALQQIDENPQQWELKTALPPRIQAYAYQFLILLIDGQKRVWPKEPLLVAVDAGFNMAVVEQNVDVFSIDATPLHDAAAQGDNENLRRLITAQTDINQLAGPARQTLLIFAVRSNKLTTVKLLVEEYKANVNLRDAHGNTAMHHAARLQFNEIVRYLISKGANRYLLNKLGYNVIDFAVEYATPVLISKLLQDDNPARAFIDLNGGRVGTLLHVAVKAGRLEMMQALVGLLESKKKVLNIQQVAKVFDRDGNAFFHLAVCSGNKEVVAYLVQRGLCRLDDKNREGDSVLHLAVKYCDDEMVNILLAKTDERYPWPYLVGVNNDGESVFHLAESALLQHKGTSAEERALKVLTAINQHKTELFVTNIKRNLLKLNLKQKLSIKIFCAGKYKEFITSKEFHTILIGSAPHDFINTHEIEFLLNAASDVIAPALKSAVISLKEFNIPKLTEELKRCFIKLQLVHQTHKHDEELGVQLKAEITYTEEEKLFKAVLNDVLFTNVFCAISILSGKARRQLVTADQIQASFSALSGQCFTAGMVLGKEIGSTLSPPLLDEVSKRFGLGPATVATATGAAVGGAVGGVLKLISHVIGKTTDKKAQQCAERISAAFEGINDKVLVDIDSIEAVSKRLVNCYRDQINRLVESSVRSFAQYVGQKIIEHIAQGRDEYEAEPSLRLLVVKKIKQWTSQKIEERKKIPLALRCFKGLRYQAEQDFKSDSLRQHRLIRKDIKEDDANNTWYAPGIIVHTGAKLLMQAIDDTTVCYYTLGKDYNYPRHLLYGFCSITQAECDFLTTEAGFEKNYMVQDIFAEKEVTVASVVTKPILPMLRERQVTKAPVKLLATSTSIVAAEDVSVKPEVGYAAVDSGAGPDVIEHKQAVDVLTTAP